MSCPFTGNFRQQHLIPVLSWLFNFDNALVDGEASSFPYTREEIEHIFYFCGGSSYISDTVLSKFTFSDYQFWLASEAARFIILSKLKGIFASPQEMLVYLESSVDDLFQSFKSRTTTGTNGGTFTKRDVARVEFHCILYFHMDTLLLSATRGGFSMNVPPQIPSPPLSMFYINNQKSCTEWINRYRNCLFRISVELTRSDALFSSHWAWLVCRSGMAIIKEYRRFDVEFETLVCNVVYALISVKCFEQIYDLKVYFENVGGIDRIQDDMQLCELGILYTKELYETAVEYAKNKTMKSVTLQTLFEQIVRSPFNN